MDIAAETFFAATCGRVDAVPAALASWDQPVKSANRLD